MPHEEIENYADGHDINSHKSRPDANAYFLSIRYLCFLSGVRQGAAVESKTVGGDRESRRGERPPTHVEPESPVSWRGEGKCAAISHDCVVLCCEQKGPK